MVIESAMYLSMFQKLIFIMMVSLGINLHAAGTLPQPNPNRANVDKHRLHNVERVVSSAVDKKTIAGGQIAIWRTGHLAFHQTFGYSDLEFSTPLQSSASYRLLSMSSIFTAIAILQLVEQGKLLLSDSVVNIIPEFKTLTIYESNQQFFSKQLTILQLLLHTAGFTASSGTDQIALEYFKAGIMPGFLYKNQMWADYKTDQFLAELAKLPLVNKPGERYLKSLSYDILGIIIERVTGLTYADYLSTHIYKPMGLQDTTFNYVPVEQTRLANLYKTDKLKGLVAVDTWANSQWKRKRGMYSASAGLLSSMRDMLELCKLILNPQTSKHTKKYTNILSSITTNRLRRRYLNLNHVKIEDRISITSPDFLVSNIQNISVGLGGWVVNADSTSSPVSENTFVITSETGSFLIIDPYQELIIVFLTQTISDESYYHVIRLQEAIVETVYQALGPK